MPLNFAYNWLSCFRNDETTPGCVAGASFYCVCWGGGGGGGRGRGGGGEGGGGGGGEGEGEGGRGGGEDTTYLPCLSILL